MRAEGSSRNKNKRLTDFFVQRPSAPIAASSTATTTMATTRRKQASKIVTNGGQSSINCAAPSQTRKRARSPDDISPAFPLPPTKLKSAKKHSERSTTAVAYPSSSLSRNSLARRPTPVRVHNDTLVASTLHSYKKVVLSSQSDEAELALPIAEPRDLVQVVQGVHTWRRKTFESSNSTPLCEDADPLPPSSTPGSPSSDAQSVSLPFDAAVRKTSLQMSTTSECLPSSPDTNDFPPLPPTPEPIDSATKTAKIIAEIKARAFAANQSSDDESLSFRELEDSDDGDLLDALPLIGSTKPRSPLPALRTKNGLFSSPLSSVPPTPNDATVGHRTLITLDDDSPRPARTSARTRKPAPVSHLPVTIAGSSTSVRATKPLLPNRKKSRTTNPLLALLREKESQDKRGTSSAALRLAEEAVRQGSHRAWVGSDDEPDTLCRSRLEDEQAAWKAVHAICKSTSPVDSGDVEDFTVGDRESKMLGAVAGEAINKILNGDKGNKGKERAHDAGQKTTLGVPLWLPPSDEDMEVDSTSILPLSGHPILARLSNFLLCGDDSLLDLVLRSGALSAVPSDTLLFNMPRLLSMTLFASSLVSDALCIALRDLWGSNQVQMPFSAILSALLQLRANPSTLEGLKSTLITEPAQKIHITRETLLKALKRLLSVVKAAGFAGAFASDDVADVVLSLVFLGLDPLTFGELGTQLNVTMDVVCNYGATDTLLHDIHEKVLSFATQLLPINKARLVSLFASGSGRTTRIARSLAYRLLVSDPSNVKHQAPPLEPLITLLSPDAGSCELFDVTNESTDYEELKHYISILSVALIDIAPYVEEERAVTMKSKSKKSPASLESLRRVLEVLQSKIVDTRAAHLDRSRTKAAIQRLTMRLNYERTALIGIPRASTLKAYFSSQRP